MIDNSPSAVFERVVFEPVVRGPNGQTHAVLVVRKGVAAYFSPSALHQRHAGVTIVVDIVVCEHSAHIE